MLKQFYPHSHDGSMVLLYMVTWIPTNIPPNASIYTSTMDPMGLDTKFGFFPQFSVDLESRRVPWLPWYHRQEKVSGEELMKLINKVPSAHSAHSGARWYLIVTIKTMGISPRKKGDLFIGDLTKSLSSNYVGALGFMVHKRYKIYRYTYFSDRCIGQFISGGGTGRSLTPHCQVTFIILSHRGFGHQAILIPGGAE